MKVIIFALVSVLAIVVADDCECTREYNPVCANNELTYENPCLLRCAQETDDALQFFYPGECGSPNFNCPCTREYRPFCGTNDYTYANPCLFRCAKKTFEFIEIAYKGKCGNPRTTSKFECGCSFLYNPVCASNGVTYSNECDLECDQKHDKQVSLIHIGECEYVNQKYTRII
ncbi:PREDICTED: serine protease inhibitor dipetalogastin-like [Nicrophorus vespilloides]|uniref:Serine protease inhibitor dipetalogastin-like n=1 Tax=Nicrophorus vespilloides TaxID=110193 RepID=A0ABM1MUN2_NICVS|nr:PREDICTED: serine protease inhibitor dipetalogastin-like [Nicrophorus vespilloides]